MPNLSQPRNHIAFVEVTQGELDSGARAGCEAALFAHLDESGVIADLITINGTGCFFTIDERYSNRLRAAAAPLNAALRLRPGCARLGLVRGEADWPLPSLTTILRAIAQQRLEVIHITADVFAVDLIVNETDAPAIAATLSSLCRPAVRRTA